MLVAYLMAGSGVLVLAVVVLVVLGRMRRCTRAAAALRGGLARGAAGLPAIGGSRR